MKTITRRYHDARHDLLDADLLLFRNGGIIARGGRGLHSHSAFAGWHNPANHDSRYRRLLCLEQREWRGGRAVMLSSQVGKFPGRIDVFRLELSDNQRVAIVAGMLGETGQPYNWAELVWVSALHLPLVRLFAIPETDDAPDVSRARGPKFCSWLTEHVARTWGGTHIAQGLPAHLVEPADQYRAVADRYFCTLVP